MIRTTAFSVQGIDGIKRKPILNNQITIKWAWDSGLRSNEGTGQRSGSLGFWQGALRAWKLATLQYGINFWLKNTLHPTNRTNRFQPSPLSYQNTKPLLCKLTLHRLNIVICNNRNDHHYTVKRCLNVQSKCVIAKHTSFQRLTYDRYHLQLFPYSQSDKSLNPISYRPVMVYSHG